MFPLKFIPDVHLLFWVVIAIGLDLLTGVLKAKLVNQDKITSHGFRDTLQKIVQYSIAISLTTLLANAAPLGDSTAVWISKGLLAFIIYIEAYSICENALAFNPTGKFSTMIIKPLMKILTLGLEKSKLQFPEDKPTDEQKKGSELSNNPTKKTLLLLGVICMLGISACKTIKPGTNSSYTKTDTTIINYKPVDVKVPGATVVNNINVDSLLSVLAASFKSEYTNSSAPDIDKILKEFKAGLNTSPVTVTDPETKVQLKYWVDEFGKLNMQCSSKDQTIQALVAEVTRLTNEVTKKETVEVQYKMTWWGWMICGYAAFLTFIVAICLIMYYKR